jgi:hypothetical protein
METWLIILILAVVAVLVVAGIVLVLQAQKKRQTDELRGRFGSEYDRAVAESGDRTRAERELQSREKRVERLQLRPLAETERGQYAERWRSVQAQFVDDPGGAVKQADSLVNDVMTSRGYPMGEFDQRSADISVDHPQVVANYRAARGVADRNEQGQANTEDLRQAMVHYRELFDELLHPEPVGARR